MIHKLYLMFENGICVFDKDFYTFSSKEADSQVFTGFISAIGNFASEALGSTLESIQLQTGEQLAIMRHEPSRLIVVCIADGRDHEKLLASILLKILDRFVEIYKKELENEDGSLYDKTSSNFDKEIDIILKNKVSSRGNWKMILGIVLGLGILGFLVLATLNRAFLNSFPGSLFFAAISNPLLAVYYGSIGESLGMIMAALMFFVGILFMVPAFIAGLLSGNRVRGLIAGLIMTIGTYFLLIISAAHLRNSLGIDLRGWFLGISPLIFFLTSSVAFVAGYLTERWKLYKFQEPTIKKGRLSKLLIFKRK